MIEFKAALIHQDKKNTNKIDISFDKGDINYINYSDKAIFDFLISKEKYLDEGSYIIDGTSFIPYDDSSDKTLFFLAVNSQNVSLVSCFVVEKENKKTRFDEIQNKLIALKELPLRNDYEKIDKIRRIFDTLVEENVNFILVDFNQEIIKDNFHFVNPILSENSDKTTIICLENENNVVNEPLNEADLSGTEMVELNITNYDSKLTTSMVNHALENSEPKTKNKNDGYLLFSYKLKAPLNKFTYILNYLLRNMLVMFFLYLSFSGFYLTLALSGQYFNLDNSLLGIMFIALSIIFYGLYFYNLYSCFDFMHIHKGEEHKKRFKFVTISNSVIIVLASVTSYFLYFAILNVNENFSPEVDITIQIVFMVIIAITSLLIPLFIKHVFRFTKWLTKKLSED